MDSGEEWNALSSALNERTEGKEIINTDVRAHGTLQKVVAFVTNEGSLGCRV